MVTKHLLPFGTFVSRSYKGAKASVPPTGSKETCPEPTKVPGSGRIHNIVSCSALVPMPGPGGLGPYTGPYYSLVGVGARGTATNCLLKGVGTGALGKAGQGLSPALKGQSRAHSGLRAISPSDSTTLTNPHEPSRQYHPRKRCL